ncbi:hypothetical protein PanWU01x14_323690 [Parasponia andersonii]|uniref:Uncharacterized protein n=1 Tax=Parasponia andersonii TaxID=3476 RepID=A0A2P5AKN2_PARAD|nr:hypothetical protein PanWU01x14_323690 [Parasponia andersonii]
MHASRGVLLCVLYYVDRIVVLVVINDFWYCDVS